MSVRDFTPEEVLGFLDLAARFEDFEEPILRGRVLANLFFEPSTRTRLSFESAMVRLGGQNIGFADAGISSVAKGESLADTVRVVQNYCDIIVLRHKLEGAARLAADAADVPVVNAGDGANQHPTQTLLDLYTLRKRFGRFDGLRVAFLGDLKYSRTVHSLIGILAQFGCDLVLVSPPELRLPKDLIEDIPASSRSRVREQFDPSRLPEDVDVFYTTRIQRERFPDPVEFERVRHAYRIDRKSIEALGRDVVVMHPLPRVDEISTDLDAYAGAAYFDQARNGIVVRKAVLALLLGAAP